VKAMMFAGSPDFVEEVGAGHVERAVEVVGEAALLAARGADEGAKFGFQEEFLAGLGAQDHDQGYGILGELGIPAGWVATRSLRSGGCVLFTFRHGGGIVPHAGEKKSGHDGRHTRPVS
jgi:hypothetical protein